MDKPAFLPRVLMLTNKPLVRFSQSAATRLTGAGYESINLDEVVRSPKAVTPVPAYAGMTK